MWTKVTYLVVVIYLVTLGTFMIAYRQGLDLFWVAAPVTMFCGGYIGVVWYLRKRKKI